MSDFANKTTLGLTLAAASYAMFTLHGATMNWLGASFALWQLISARRVVMLIITTCQSRSMNASEATKPAPGPFLYFQ